MRLANQASLLLRSILNMGIAQHKNGNITQDRKPIVKMLLWQGLQGILDISRHQGWILTYFIQFFWVFQRQIENLWNPSPTWLCHLYMLSPASPHSHPHTGILMHQASVQVAQIQLESIYHPRPSVFLQAYSYGNSAFIEMIQHPIHFQGENKFQIRKYKFPLHWYSGFSHFYF